MLMLFMALSFVVPGPGGKNVASHQVASPEKLGIYNSKAPSPYPYSLKPQWQVVVSASQNGMTPTSPAESNLEHWRNIVQKVSVEDIAPRQAIPRIKEYSHISISRIKGLTSGHRPWCLEINELSLDRPPVAESYLIYDLMKSPTVNSPYYEAFVYSMPNIRCKAKTVEALEVRLLQQYSQYLAMLLQNEEDYPTREPKMRRELAGLDGAFIAWLIGATSEGKKPDANQKEVVIEQPRSKKVPQAWNNWEGYAFGIEFVF